VLRFGGDLREVPAPDLWSPDLWNGQTREQGTGCGENVSQSGRRFGVRIVGLWHQSRHPPRITVDVVPFAYPTPRSSQDRSSAQLWWITLGASHLRRLVFGVVLATIHESPVKRIAGPPSSAAGLPRILSGSRGRQRRIIES
jgi:hypothetical protein